MTPPTEVEARRYIRYAIQMDQLTVDRLDQSKKRAEAADASMARIEAQLTQIQISLAGLATKDSVGNWGMTLTATIVATGLGVGAMMLQPRSTQISAFQAGLGAIRAVTSAYDLATPRVPVN